MPNLKQQKNLNFFYNKIFEYKNEITFPHVWSLLEQRYIQCSKSLLLKL